jgi:hypothetical protein
MGTKTETAGGKRRPWNKLPCLQFRELASGMNKERRHGAGGDTAVEKWPNHSLPQPILASQAASLGHPRPTMTGEPQVVVKVGNKPG